MKSQLMGIAAGTVAAAGSSSSTSRRHPSRSARFTRSTARRAADRRRRSVQKSSRGSDRLRWGCAAEFGAHGPVSPACTFDRAVEYVAGEEGENGASLGSSR
jgi:hypothetical protein